MKFLLLLLLATRSLARPARAQDSLSLMMNRLLHIDQLIGITLNPADAAKLRDYFHQRLQQAGDSLSEKDEIHNQDIIDFIAGEQIPFYGHFDWKQQSISLDAYVKNAIKKNFDSTCVFDSGCDLKALPTVSMAVKCYVTAVRQAGLQLCYMDIGGDSYQLFVIRPEDYERLKELVTAIGFRIVDESLEW